MIHGGVNRRQALALMAGAALAPAVAGAAFAQGRDFLIFFDWQRAVVTTEARKLLVLIKGRIGPSSRVTIVGHCDTAEANPDRLSRARALEVQKALLALGVPASAPFTVIGRGASQPFEPTPPNTREPRNRRVEITVE